jgi:hypothetical protein
VPPSTGTQQRSWISQHAARIGAGHFALVQGEDGAWRVALVDEWRIERKALQAAFDAVHPDGSLDFCGGFLNKGHLPQDLGRADVFFAALERECALIDELWPQEADGLISRAPPRWAPWRAAPLPALIRAKAAQRLAAIGSGRAPDEQGGRLALAGALQENFELCAMRSKDVAPEVMAMIEQMDAVPSKARRCAKRKPA